MNFILNHDASASTHVPTRTSIKICEKKEATEQRASRKGAVSTNININAASGTCTKAPAQHATNPADGAPASSSQNTEQVHFAGRAYKRKDDSYVNGKENCIDRIKKQRHLKAQWDFSDAAVYTTPKTFRQKIKSDPVKGDKPGDFLTPGQKRLCARMNNRDNDKDYHEVTRPEKRQIRYEHDKNFQDVTRVEKKQIVRNYDKEYKEVTKPVKRQILREKDVNCDKNYNEVTCTKKREIKREYVEVEGSKPKKFNYNKKGPEVTVMQMGENGPQLMKKCLKTQQFIQVTMSDTSGDKLFAGMGLKVRQHIKEPTSKNLLTNRGSYNPISHGGSTMDGTSYAGSSRAQPSQKKVRTRPCQDGQGGLVEQTGLVVPSDNLTRIDSRQSMKAPKTSRIPQLQRRQFNSQKQLLPKNEF